MSTPRGTFNSNKRKSKGRDEKSVEESLVDIYNKLESLITSDTMEKMIHKLKSDIRKENEDMIQKLESRIFDLENSNDRLKQTVQSQEETIIELQKVQCEVYSKYNDLEQHGRKNSIRISGLRDTSDSESVDDCVKTVVSFVNRKLNIPVQSEDIDIAHRLGKFNKDRPRNIIIKFVHRRKKHEIIRARRQLKGTVCSSQFFPPC
ncbi:uncharacterized protein [Argopecten irradians]|uniref:uncharacterized protein n=1 Tax=Argopecten irradians TaxID=31199 RepID=UPI00371951E2